MVKVGEYELPRRAVYLAAGGTGVVAGIINSLLPLDFSIRPALLGWLLLSIPLVVVLHEGTHGLAAVFFGHRPLFGLKPPLVYITFTEKIPRGYFILIALAPLVVLDVLFGLMYYHGTLRLFADFCFIINTLGAAGDVWITVKLISVPPGSLIQDTKTGFEVWRPGGVI
jgi:hypothetical protein